MTTFENPTTKFVKVDYPHLVGDRPIVKEWEVFPAAFQGTDLTTVRALLPTDCDMLVVPQLFAAMVGDQVPRVEVRHVWPPVPGDAAVWASATRLMSDYHAIDVFTRIIHRGPGDTDLPVFRGRLLSSELERLWVLALKHSLPTFQQVDVRNTKRVLLEFEKKVHLIEDFEAVQTSSRKMFAVIKAPTAKTGS